MHDKWQEQIPYYVTGRLTVTERTALELHLEGCATCRKRVSEWMSIASAVQTDVSGRATRLPPLDHARYIAVTRSLPPIRPLESSRIEQTIAANGSLPAQDQPPRKRKKDMAISSLPISSARGNTRAIPRSGNAMAILLAGIFIVTLIAGFTNLNKSQIPPGGTNPIAGMNLLDNTGTPSPTPTGTREPTHLPPTHEPTHLPPTFVPSETPPTREPTHVPPTLLPSRTPQCIVLYVIPGFEAFFEPLAHFLREHGFCVTLIYPPPRTPSATPTVEPTHEATETREPTHEATLTREPTHIPPTPTHRPEPTHLPTFTPVPTHLPEPTHSPTQVPPTHPPEPTHLPTPTREPTHVPPTQPPEPTHLPTFTPPPPPTHPPEPTHLPTFTPPPPPTHPPEPTHLPTFTPPPPPATPTRPPEPTLQPTPTRI